MVDQVVPFPQGGQRNAEKPRLFPEVQTRDYILSILIFVRVEDLNGVSNATHTSSLMLITYLACR